MFFVSVITFIVYLILKLSGCGTVDKVVISNDPFLNLFSVSRKDGNDQQGEANDNDTFTKKTIMVIVDILSVKQFMVAVPCNKKPI